MLVCITLKPPAPAVGFGCLAEGGLREGKVIFQSLGARTWTFTIAGEGGLILGLGRSPGVGNSNLPHFLPGKTRAVMPGVATVCGSQRGGHD